MNINQINALRKVASARENAYALEKQAGISDIASKAWGKAKTAGKFLKNSGKSVYDVAKKDGMRKALEQAGTHAKEFGGLATKNWKALGPGAQAGIAAAAGAAAATGLSRLAGSGKDEDQNQPQARGGYRYR